MSISIKPISIKLVATYEYDTTDDICQLCKNPLTFDCLECETKKTNQKCYKSNGKCQHTFHVHCISKWLNTKNDNCPTCILPFEYDNIKLDNPRWREEYKKNTLIMKRKINKTPLTNYN